MMPDLLKSLQRLTSPQREQRLRFAEWLSEPPSAQTIRAFSNPEGRNLAGSPEGYVEYWVNQCKKTPTILQIGSTDIDREVASQISKHSSDLDTFGLVIQHPGVSLEFRDKRIDTIDVAHNNGALRLVRCAIRRLHIESGTRSILTIIDCEIGELTLDDRSVLTLEWAGGKLTRLHSPLVSAHGPFVGSVDIRRVDFSPAFENAQAYRNLRHHLTSLHNHEAASVFHTAEMRAERSRQSRIDRAISLFYWSASNYGGSSARPLAWCLLFYVLNVFYLYATNGVTWLQNVGQMAGWRHDLSSGTPLADLGRAAVFSMGETLNPLGVFGNKAFLIAKAPAIGLVSGLLGIFTALSLALFILAIRRRFRLDRTA